MFLNANKHLAVSATKLALGRKLPKSLSSSSSSLSSAAASARSANAVRMMTSFARPLTTASIGAFFGAVLSCYCRNYVMILRVFRATLFCTIMNFRSYVMLAGRRPAERNEMSFNVVLSHK